MLYALAHPASLLVLLLSFVVGITLQGWVCCLVADRTRVRQPRLEGRLKPDPRCQVDPFGALAAAISGLGWSLPVDLPGRRRRTATVAVALSGPVLNVLLGVAALVAWRASYGPVGADAGGPLPVAAVLGGPAYFLQHGGPLSASAALFLVGCSQLFLGALSLVPVPPLAGGRLLLALAPRTRGWQQAEHQLVERNIGVAALLVLLLIPLGGSVPMLPTLLDMVLTPLVRVICGG